MPACHPEVPELDDPLVLTQLLFRAQRYVRMLTEDQTRLRAEIDTRDALLQTLQTAAQEAQQHLADAQAEINRRDVLLAEHAKSSAEEIERRDQIIRDLYAQRPVWRRWIARLRGRAS